MDSAYTCYVYAIHGGDLVKIGVSQNPWTRLDAFKTGSPVALTLICAWKFTRRNNSADYDARRWEEKLHDLLSDRRQHGEWFDLTQAETLDLFAEPPPNASYWGDVRASDGSFWESIVTEVNDG